MSVFDDNKFNLINFTNDIRDMLEDNDSKFGSNPSPRTVGDICQSLIEDLFLNGSIKIIGNPIAEKFARRAMADVAFEDKEGNYIMVDIKTHNTTTVFNMPNLTSVERLSRFYEDDKNYFSILLITYSINNGLINFNEVKFIPIEYLSWSCLTLGALGWGQIQIANSNKISINQTQTRRQWMLQLCDALELFYPNEISKINERIERFKKVRIFWEEHK